MLDKELREIYNIVNINSTKIAKLTKLFVYNFLYIYRDELQLKLDATLGLDLGLTL